MSSPKRTTNTVKRTICTVRARSLEKLNFATASRVSATAIIDAATLTTVFPIRIVTRSLLGCSRSNRRYLPVNGFPVRLFFNFLLSKEKRATSDPEKKAEKIKSKKRNRSLICQPTSKY
jgi:hypothetical protein